MKLGVALLVALACFVTPQNCLGQTMPELWEIHPSQPSEFLNFGSELAMDGARMVVGAAGDSELGFFAGAVFVYERQGTVWVETAKLTASDGAAGQNFGGAVAIQGDWVLVGAPGSTGLAAYLFEWDGSSWLEIAKLEALDPATVTTFGSAVAFANQCVLVADVFNTDGGAVYAFEDGVGGWSQLQKIRPSISTIQEFGRAISAQGTRLWVTASNPGRSYVFELDGDLWIEEHALSGPSGYGRTATLDGDRACVRFFHPTEPRVYTYEYDGTSWQDTGLLSPPSPETTDLFGWSLDLEGDRLVVGAKHATLAGERSGVGLVYEWTGTEWALDATLLGTGTEPFSCLGEAAAIEGDFVILGEGGDDLAGAATGAVLVFYLGSGFIRGDVNRDGFRDISDAIAILSGLFMTGVPPIACESAADVNDDGQVDISDAVAQLSHLFVPGSGPFLPPDQCFVDPTPDSLVCDISCR